MPESIDIPRPAVTDDDLRVGGTFKETPDDFVVEELPLYEPEDEGQHVYVRLTREGWTTPEVEDRLESLFDLDDVDIGSAGKKDRRARATQTFSLNLPNTELDEVRRRLADVDDLEVEWVRRHRNKLRTGHAIGNRFRIRVRQPDAESPVETARTIAAELEERGVPNFYGTQRFGDDGDNAERGREILAGDRREPHWKARLFVSALQSELFNEWLERRIDREGFDSLYEGDIAKKTDTGGLFVVEEPEREQPRFDREELTFTGPIYGDDLWWAKEGAGELERTVLRESGLEADDFGEVGAHGSRRRGRVHLDELTVYSDDDGLVFAFALPKGSYATVVMREFLT